MRRGGRRSYGFSLIELMVAMSIGLFLVGGLVYAYIGAKRSYNFNQAMARIQENGRFAIQLLTRDIRQAGYMGCAQNSDRIKNTLNPDAEYFARFSPPLNGFDDVSGQRPDELASALSGEELTPGADIIVVRKVGESVTPGSVEEDELYIVTNCTRAALYQATEDDADARFHISDGKILALESTIYYIADSSFADVPSLWQQQLTDSSADELVSGVVGMRISYGEDTDGDGNVDQYGNANQVDDMTHVISVRVALLLISLYKVTQQPVTHQFKVFGKITDRHLYREFITTVNVRNHSL